MSQYEALRFPAEWEPQSAIMLTWPHKNTDWRDTFEAAEATYFEIASTVLCEQNLLISCEDPSILKSVTNRLQDIANAHDTHVWSYLVPANDTWARDHGPIGVIKGNTPTLLDFTFNAWGDKFQSDKDNLINRELANMGAFRSTPMDSINFVLEGGSIESDGQGTLLTTEHCLMQASRNQHLSKYEIEQVLIKQLGVTRLLWLSAGYLQGDDTDAHIDTLARFTGPDTICYVSCSDPTDDHYPTLTTMRAQLANFRRDNGQPYKLVPLPMPTAVYRNGQRLPATYANFLITNRSVLLPTYHCTEDKEAISTLGKCFPTRKIIPIDCRSLIEQHGSLHCITMQLMKGICE